MARELNCKCGAKLVPLFSSMVCSAECDLPPEKRTKPAFVGPGLEHRWYAAFRLSSASDVELLRKCWDCGIVEDPENPRTAGPCSRALNRRAGYPEPVYDSRVVKLLPLEDGCKGVIMGAKFSVYGSKNGYYLYSDSFAPPHGTHTDLRNYTKCSGKYVLCPRCGRKIDENTPD